MSSHLLLPCPKCGAVNRAETERLASGPVCARCKTYLDPARPAEVTPEQFDRVTGQSDVPVLVDFWAPWCGPCKSMVPVVDEIARENQGKIQVVKVNTDLHPELGARFGVRGVPTFIAFKNGAESGRQVGAVPKQTLVNMAGG